jgi:hypothetical protein
VNFDAVKKIIRYLVPLISLCVALTIIGCDHTGKYINEKQPQNYFELKKNGIFIIVQGDVSKSGKYVMDGNNVILTLDSGGTAKGKIEGKTFIDNGGGRFTLQ